MELKAVSYAEVQEDPRLSYDGFRLPGEIVPEFLLRPVLDLSEYRMAWGRDVLYTCGSFFDFEKGLGHLGRSFRQGSSFSLDVGFRLLVRVRDGWAQLPAFRLNPWVVSPDRRAGFEFLSEARSFRETLDWVVSRLPNASWRNTDRIVTDSPLPAISHLKRGAFPGRVAALTTRILELGMAGITEDWYQGTADDPWSSGLMKAVLARYPTLSVDQDVPFINARPNVDPSSSATDSS